MSLFWIAAVCAGVGLLTCAMNWLALIPWRKARAAHWTERARLLFPVRNAAGSNLLYLPACLALALYLNGTEDLPTLVLAGGTAWLSTVAAVWPFEREICPWLTFRDWLYETLTNWLFWFAGWFVVIGAVAMAPPDFDRSLWLVLGSAAALQTWLVFGGSIWLVRRLGLVTEAPERLRRIVEAEAEKAGARFRSVFLMRSSSANAFAMVHTGDIAVTRRAYDLMTDEELAAICAHEMGHLIEPKRIHILRFLGSLAWISWIFVRPLWPAFGPAAPIAVGGFTYLVRYFLIRLSLAMEVRADAIARSNEVQDGIFARALVHLSELNFCPAVLPGNQRTHPQVYERLVAAGITPDFPRPAPPEEMSWHGYIPKCSFFLLLLLTVAKALS